jgi:hypothetical protein
MTGSDGGVRQHEEAFAAIILGRLSGIVLIEHFPVSGPLIFFKLRGIRKMLETA